MSAPAVISFLSRLATGVKAIALALLCAALAACANLGSRTPEAALYDLGPGMPPLAAPELNSLEVLGPSWLESTFMQYRLVYVDAARRSAYSGSRWSAAPTELLAHGLRRALVVGTAPVPGCRLRVELGEFIQVFDSPTASRGLIEARLVLLPAHGVETIARQSFSLERSATSADAQGGVAALAGLTADLATKIQHWLAGPAGAVCR